MRPRIVCLVLLCAFSVTWAQIGHGQTIGKYRGRVISQGKELPVVTTLYRDKKKQIVGRYIIIEGKELTKGTLTGFKSTGRFEGEFTWSDKFGQGTLRLTFASDLESFDGYWGVNQRTNFRWNGDRELLIEGALRRREAAANAKKNAENSTNAANNPNAATNPTDYGKKYAAAGQTTIANTIAKIVGVSVTNYLSKRFGEEPGLGNFLLSKMASFGRDKLIESAIQDLFPKFNATMIQNGRNVISNLLDGDFSLKNYGATAAKELIANELGQRNPTLAKVMTFVDFVHEFHKHQQKNLSR